MMRSPDLQEHYWQPGDRFIRRYLHGASNLPLDAVFTIREVDWQERMVRDTGNLWHTMNSIKLVGPERDVPPGAEYWNISCYHP